ncbi:PAS domain S-box-containing protein [Halopseudomonas pachastrellae]|nr:PAS domain S-box-containing protein [Halopseudomonas pachastrellae]
MTAPMTTPDHTRNGRLALPLGMLLLTLCFLYLGISAWREHDRTWQAQQYGRAEAALRDLQQEQQSLRLQARIAAFSLSEDPDTLRLLRRIAYLVRLHGLQDPEVKRLRSQLENDLSGFWQLLQQAGAKELQIHLAPDGVALLRMQRPERWADLQDAKRSLLLRSQQEGTAVDGLALYPEGASESAVVPVFASQAPDSRVIATLQVGFPVFAQHRDNGQQSLALLVRPEDELASALPNVQTGRWLLADSTGPVNLGVLRRATQALNGNGGPQIFMHDHHVWLADLHPRAAYRVGTSAALDDAALLLCRDISDAYAAHRTALLRQAGSWLLAWLIAITLFNLLLIYSRRAARRQMALHAEAISAQSQRRERDRQLLEIISRSQSDYIQQNDFAAALKQLLQQILELTHFTRADFFQAQPDDDGKLQLLQLGSSTSAPLPDALQPMLLRVLREAHPEQISANPDRGTPRALALPLMFAGCQRGVLALSGGEQPLDPELRSFLAPLQNALGQLLHAQRQQQDNQAMQHSLERQRQALRHLNRLAADPALTLQQRLVQLLDLGCDYLRLDLGLVSHIEEDRYRVEAASSTEGAPPVGSLFDFGQTYCSLTWQAGDVLAIDRMGQSRFSGHPCYRQFGLESYIGVALIVGDQRFGTLNFSSASPRSQRFDEADTDFVRLCGRWCSSLLEQAAAQHQREALLQRFHKLTQHLPGMVFQYQVNQSGHGWFPYASEGIANIYDMTPEQAALDAQPAIDLIHPDDLPMVQEDIRRSSIELSDWRSEYRVRHPRLGEIWVAGYSSPELLENGDLVWHGFIADISERKQIEQRLNEERARLARIIDATRVGTWEWRLDNNTLEASVRWYQMLGYQPEELAPLSIDTWASLMHPKDVPAIRAQLYDHLRGGSDHLSYLCRARHRDGRWIWVQSQGQVTERDAAGRALAMSGIHSDVSAEVRASEEVREARTYLSAVINASTEVAIIATDPDGLITLFNSGAQRLLGYSSEEVVGSATPMQFHLPSEVAERSSQLSAQIGQSIEGLELLLHEPRQGKSDIRAWTFVRKDGRQRQVRLTVTRIADDNDQLIGFLGMASDITELVYTSRALQASESRYRGMVSNLPGAVYRCHANENWTMSYMSQEIERISGYPATDFINNARRSYASIIVPEDLPLTLQCLALTPDNPNFELSYRLIHANGHQVQVREKGRGEFDKDGQLLGFDGFIWDATEQARVEQMKSQFVSTVSHELRTPLTAIIGSLKLIHGGALGQLPDSMQSLLGVAVQNSETLHRLINDLLDMDKLTAGKLQIELVRQPLEPLLQQALQLNQSYAEQYDVRQQLGQVDAVEVEVDAQRLGQVLANYLSNAAKFSNAGDSITLSAIADERWVEISVEDRGIGIPEQEQPRIFDKFFQVDSSNTRKRAGSGLGLAISRELARRMGGEVGFMSTAGVGSRFWIRLPLAGLATDELRQLH